MTVARIGCSYLHGVPSLEDRLGHSVARQTHAGECMHVRPTLNLRV